jgi:hypothetical protein
MTTSRTAQGSSPTCGAVHEPRGVTERYGAPTSSAACTAQGSPRRWTAWGAGPARARRSEGTAEERRARRVTAAMALSAAGVPGHVPAHCVRANDPAGNDEQKSIRRTDTTGVAGVLRSQTTQAPTRGGSRPPRCARTTATTCSTARGLHLAADSSEHMMVVCRSTEAVEVEDRRAWPSSSST